MSHSLAYLLAGLFLVPGILILALLALGRKPTPRFEPADSKSGALLKPEPAIETAAHC